MRYGRGKTIVIIAIAILVCLPFGKKWYKFLIKSFYEIVYKTEYVYGEDIGLKTKTIYLSEAKVTGVYDTDATSFIIPSKIIIGHKLYDVTSIGDYAFRNCVNLESITLPDGVTSIGDDAFRNCVNLESITIPDGVTSIGNCAFWNCTSLTSITLPDGVTSIGISAFLGCANLTSITLPDGVTSIGNCTFWNCTSLENITLPDGVTSIGESAFSGCRNLNVVINNSKTNIKIGDEAFNGCESVRYMK